VRPPERHLRRRAPVRGRHHRFAALDARPGPGGRPSARPWHTRHPRRQPMTPRITVLTLGVDDLERALRFYRDGLGLPAEGIVGQEFEHGAVAFFDLRGGLKLAVWPRTSIAHDAGLPVQPPSVTDLTVGHNVNSRAEVDEVMAQAERAGARIVKAA